MIYIYIHTQTFKNHYCQIYFKRQLHVTDMQVFKRFTQINTYPFDSALACVSYMIRFYWLYNLLFLKRFSFKSKVCNAEKSFCIAKILTTERLTAEDCWLGKPWEGSGNTEGFAASAQGYNQQGWGWGWGKLEDRTGGKKSGQCCLYFSRGLVGFCLSKQTLHFYLIARILCDICLTPLFSQTARFVIDWATTPL